MAFSGLMLTTDGKIINAKAQQGKILRFTRVGIGDGQSGGSMINRTGLTSEKLSLPIDAIQLVNNGEETAITVTLDNKALTEGFYFRELGLFAEDPDTRLERLCYYDNAAQDAEHIPDGLGGVSVHERLKLLLKLEATPNVTFDPSGNPLYLTREDLEAILATREPSNTDYGYFDDGGEDHLPCGYFEDEEFTELRIDCGDLSGNDDGRLSIDCGISDNEIF